LRQTLGEIARTRVRLARLEAERVGAESVEYPSLVHPDGENALSLIINAENEIFDSRRTALSLEISNLEELKKLLENEVSSLEAKLEGHREQVELATGNLENIKTLVARGVSRNAPLLDAQRSLFQLESQGLDLEDGIFRARQRINEADRDIVALESRRQSEVNRDLQNNQGQYESLLIRAETLRRVIEENGAATIAIDAALTITEYSITRNIDGQAQVIDAEPGDPILPGDVLTVEQILVNEE
jgi:polysaccharide export outer membrane protein